MHSTTKPTQVIQVETAKQAMAAVQTPTLMPTRPTGTFMTTGIVMAMVRHPIHLTHLTVLTMGHLQH